MASIQQHNQIMKIIFGNTKHFSHVMSSEEVKKLTMIEASYPLTRQPVCGGCERLGLWHKDMFGKPLCVCKKCGAITKDPITYATYLASGYDIDETGMTAREVMKHRRYVIDNYVPDYGH